MSSREAILARVRAANERVQHARSTRLHPTLRPQDQVPDPGAPWEYGRPTPLPDVLTRFAERVADYRAAVVEVTHEGVPSAIADALAAAGVTSVVVPDGLPRDWVDGFGARVDLVTDDPPLSHAALDATGAVVTTAAAGIAETGTIVLDHGPGQGRRALTLVPDVHICVVRADQVVSDVPEAVLRLVEPLGAGRPLTWISGPSATSDIELSRVEGVHGPRTLHLIIARG